MTASRPYLFCASFSLGTPISVESRCVQNFPESHKRCWDRIKWIQTLIDMQPKKVLLLIIRSSSPCLSEDLITFNKNIFTLSVWKEVGRQCYFRRYRRNLSVTYSKYLRLFSNSSKVFRVMIAVCLFASCFFIFCEKQARGEVKLLSCELERGKRSGACSRRLCLVLKANWGRHKDKLCEKLLEPTRSKSLQLNFRSWLSWWCG